MSCKFGKGTNRDGKFPDPNKTALLWEIDMIKKVIYYCILFVGVFLMLGIGGCSKKPYELDIADDGRIHIVCTTFVQYDWVKNLIAGNEEQFHLTVLMESGNDLHNFQPSALDIARISMCDMFIYVGGESDSWAEDVIKDAVHSNMYVINMMEALDKRLVEEEAVDGMEEHDHEAHGGEYDEHVWLSLRNAAFLTEYISVALGEIEQEHAQLYTDNCIAYTAKLETLDTAFEQVVTNGSVDTLLFADRFAFRYFVEDYDLKYYAAFEGCSAQTGASFAIVAFLSEKLDELGLDFVIVTDRTSDRLARVIIENTQTKDQQILRMNSLQSISRKDIDSGVSYLSAMEENLRVLKQLAGLDS